MPRADPGRELPLLEILADGRFYSGEQLGKLLGASRTAILKGLHSLGDLGLELQAVRGKGYRLLRPVELLRHDAIISRLNGHSRSLLNELEILPRIDSTNRYLLERSGTGLACFAEYQHAGRGRGGRRWQSPFASGICCSVRWRFDGVAHPLSGLSLAAGVWVVDALRAAGIREVGLKWPNDVLHGGAKLAGILVEAKGEMAGSCQIVIGVGLNIDMPPVMASGIEQPWTDLKRVTGRQPGRNRIAGLLLHHLLTGLSVYEEKGLPGFQARWEALDCTAGRQVQIQHASGSLLGTAQGIDERGAIRLRCPDGFRHFHSGEVTLRIR